MGDSIEEKSESVDGHFKINPRLLDHFSIAMYKNASKAISELVSNCHDADARKVEITLPSDWDAAKAKIIIEDNGDGMTALEVLDKFLYLGYDRRVDFQKTELGRMVLGNKGIGKLAGLGLARKMHYTTTKAGKTSEFTIDRDEINKDVDLEKFPINIVTSRRGLQKGTAVELIDINRDVNRVSPKDLRHYLAAEFGEEEKFKIIVNGVEVKQVDLPGAYFEINEEIKGYGRVKGWYKIVDRPTKWPGFSVRVRGRIVKHSSTFDLGPGVSHAINYAYIIGEVEADFLDPISPRKEIEGFTIATDRDGFNESSPSYLAFSEWARTKLKQVAARVQKDRTEKAKARIRKDKKIKKSLSKLSKEVRDQTSATIDRIIDEIPWEDEKEVIKLARSCTDIAEASDITLILDEISKNSPSDIKRFALLFSKYGLADVWKWSDIVAHRLDAISELRRIVEKFIVLELKEIHPVIENNIWLVGEDYMMMTSNQQIDTLLKKENIPHTKGANERPDFVCLSRGKKIVIIEIKNGAYVLRSDDYSQACGYVDQLKPHYPNRKKEIFMIGGKCEAASESTYGDTPIHLTTYAELLSEAEDRYREFLRILKLRGA